MKPKTFLLMLLFLPYILWVAFFAFSAMSQDVTKTHPILGVIIFILFGFSMVYSSGIIFWGIPYTVLVTGIFIWSRNKSAKEIYDSLSKAPHLLTALTTVEFLIVYLYLVLTSQIQTSLFEDIFNLILYSFLAACGIYIFGYVFVFLGKKIYTVSENLKIIKNEDEVKPDTYNI